LPRSPPACVAAASSSISGELSVLRGSFAHAPANGASGYALLFP
jgi:hypothetical protein